jgi:hypothetical protein
LLRLSIEPEGAVVSLRTGEEVEVIDEYTESPVTLRFSNSNEGEPILSIWPGDGSIRVEKGGEDVLESLGSQRLHA